MKFRLTCFAYHLVISILIALASIFLVYFVWYPAPLDKALGVTRIFLLLLGVDVIIGPVLTLMVAQQGKKTLKMDLIIIGLVQLMALGYGTYTVAQGRPVWIVYNSGRFDLVQAYEAETDGDAAKIHRGWTGPALVRVIDGVPADADYSTVFLHAKYLEPFNPKGTSQVADYSFPLAVLNKFNNPQKVKALTSQYPQADAFVPLLGKQKPLVVLIRKAEANPLAIVDLSPW